MKKFLMLLAVCSFALGTIGCGAKPAAKATAAPAAPAAKAPAAKKPAKKGLKKMKGNRMEVAEEDE